MMVLLLHLVQVDIVNNMSFSADVKKELSTIISEECCMKAELYSIIRFRSTIMISRGSFEIELITTLNSTARRIVSLFKRIYNVNLEILAYYKDRLDYKTRYVLKLQEKGTEILKDLKVINENYQILEDLNYELFEKECCKIASVRGAFLIQGSVNDPAKDAYHLEIVASNKEDANFLVETLDNVGINARVVSRSKGEVVYIKKAEQIGDFLRYTGAFNSLFFFEDQRIKRDYNNYANRMINCDIANEEKAMKAAAKQLEDIAYLDKHYGLLKLKDRLVDAVVLRNTFPDDSLSQLSEKSEELIGRYISKSGLSHCYRDLGKLVEEIKKNRGEDEE